jgi:DNA-binding transcriptional ArsR family regulator
MDASVACVRSPKSPSPYQTSQPLLRCWYDAAMPGDRCELLCLDLPKAEQLRSERLSLDAATGLAERAKALGDPTRLMLAVALADGDELCVCDLAWIAERSENLVSHHLRILRSAGLVRNRRDGKMVMYAVTEAGRALIDAVREPAKAAR